MTHSTDDELVLHYYGESDDDAPVAEHLQACARCAEAYRAIRETLEIVPVPAVPDRDAFYGQRVWGRVEQRLPPEGGSHTWLRARHLWLPASAGRWPRLSFAAAAVVVLASVFTAGRTWPREQAAVPAAVVERTGSAQNRARIAATSDHLDRSERVLLDVLNAGGDQVDLSTQQAWASDLVDSNRFYRDAAAQAGDLLTVGVLDTLERSLLDVVHGPAVMTPPQLDDLRGRLDAAALLFKVRILADELRERETAPATSGKTL